MTRGLLAAFLLAGCSTSSSDRDPWPEREIPLAETVGWLDERPVTYGAVARYLRTKEPDVFSRALEGLVVERATRAEAEPLGITVEAGLVMRHTERRMREWDERVRTASRKRSGEEIEPALWLQRVAGVSVARLREWVREHTEVELLQDRLARYEMLTSPRVEVSILVVRERAEADRLAQEAAQGASFADLARRHSLHASAPDGGRIGYPLVPADVNDAAVREALFKAREGEVVGPFPTRARQETFHQLYRVESAQPARRGSYAELGRAVVRDLEARPVHVGEYERWRRRILLRHGFVAAHAAGEP
ncbi:MAG: peptidylprolyl isomerase [Planctomycetota bacterium]